MHATAQIESGLATRTVPPTRVMPLRMTGRVHTDLAAVRRQMQRLSRTMHADVNARVEYNLLQSKEDELVSQLAFH
jgi:hypothetical protein